MANSQVDVGAKQSITIWDGLKIFWIDYVIYSFLINLVSSFTFYAFIAIISIILYLPSLLLGFSVIDLLSNLVFSSVYFPIIIAILIYWIYTLILYPLAYEGSTPGMSDTDTGLIRSNGEELFNKSALGGIGVGRAIWYYLVPFIFVQLVILITWLLSTQYAWYWTILGGIGALIIISFIFGFNISNKKTLNSALAGCHIVKY